MAMLAAEKLRAKLSGAQRDRGAGIHSVAPGAGFRIYAVVRGTLDQCFREYPRRGAGYRWFCRLVPRSLSTRTRGGCAGRPRKTSVWSPNAMLSTGCQWLLNKYARGFPLRLIQFRPV